MLQGSDLTVALSVVQCYLLYHDAVYAHVFVTPGEVEQVHPAEGETKHQEAQVLLPAAQVQPG